MEEKKDVILSGSKVVLHETNNKVCRGGSKIQGVGGEYGIDLGA